jgi:DNA-binding MarR family transcriptional regulator
MTGVRPFDAAETHAWLALVHVATLLPRHLNAEMLDARRISTAEFALLLHLSESDDGTLRMSDLAEATRISPSRVTRVVETLRKRGWIEKTPHASDGRSTTVALTDIGREQVGAAYAVQVAGARRTLFDRLSAADVETLARILGDLEQTLADEDRFE